MPDVTITATKNGPYAVTGPVTITDHNGRKIDQPAQIALCRCGQSANKPYCDGTHLSIDFDGTLAK